jgi:hypothetical protein
MIRSADVLSDIQLHTDCFSKICGEAWVSIQNNLPWYAIMREHLLRINLGYFCGINSLLAWEEQHGFGTIVINNC